MFVIFLASPFVLLRTVGTAKIKLCKAYFIVKVLLGFSFRFDIILQRTLDHNHKAFRVFQILIFQLCIYESMKEIDTPHHGHIDLN